MLDAVLNIYHINLILIVTPLMLNVIVCICATNTFSILLLLTEMSALVLHLGNDDLCIRNH